MNRAAPKPRFSEGFRRLCQVAAISGTSRIDDVVDALLLVAMIYGDGPWRTQADWTSDIKALFDLEIPSADIQAAMSRATRPGGPIVADARGSGYRLTSVARRTTQDRIAAADALERRVQASWFSEIESRIDDLASLTLWSCLLSYAGKALARHGSEAMTLLGGGLALDEADDQDDETSDSAETAQNLLLEAMREGGIDASRYNDIAAAISAFFDSDDADRVRYVAELTNSTFDFMALNVDDDIRLALRQSLPSLTIFLDTNVIYGLIGAHSQPLAGASADLLNAIRANQLPFKLYYHEKTLSEVERTIEAVGRRLSGRRFTPAVSAGMLAAPQTMSSTAGTVQC